MALSYYGLQLAGRYLANNVPPVQVQVTSPLACKVGVITMVPPPAEAVYVMVITPLAPIAIDCTLGVAAGDT